MINPFVIANAARIGQVWAGIPGIEVTPGGRLFATWFSGGEKEPSPENTIYLSISDNGGREFGDPVVMATPRDGLRAFDPTLWLAPAGQLWLIFNRGNKDTAEHGVHARICTDPAAVTPEWSAEFRVGYDVPLSLRMNKPIVLSTGNGLCPSLTRISHVTSGSPLQGNSSKGWVFLAIRADLGHYTGRSKLRTGRWRT